MGVAGDLLEQARLGDGLVVGHDLGEDARAEPAAHLALPAAAVASPKSDLGAALARDMRAAGSESGAIVRDDEGLSRAEDRQVRHVHPRLRTVPVALAGRDVRDVAGPHRALLVLSRDHPLARGDDEDLIGRVGMQLVPRSVAEGVLVQPEVAGLFADDGLRIHIADEDVARVRS